MRTGLARTQLVPLRHIRRHRVNPSTITLKPLKSLLLSSYWRRRRQSRQIFVQCVESIARWSPKSAPHPEGLSQRIPTDAIRSTRDFVRAFLPFLPLAFCHGCGGGGERCFGRRGSQRGSAPVPRTAAVNRAPTISVESSQSARVGATYEFQPDGRRSRWRHAAASRPRICRPGPASIRPAARITGTPGDNRRRRCTNRSRSPSPTPRTRSPPRRSRSRSIAVKRAAASPRCSGKRRRRRCDGSPLDDLAGYRILYGRNSRDLDHSVLHRRSGHDLLSSSPRYERYLVFRGGRRECRRPRRPADHGRHRSPSDPFIRHPSSILSEDLRNEAC